MSLRYYFDHHGPVAVARALRRPGLDVITAVEDGRTELADELLLKRASEPGSASHTAS